MTAAIVFGLVAVAAIVLVLWVGRFGAATAGEEAIEVVAVTGDGLSVDGSGAPVAWPAIWEITVVTRRGVGATWFGFEVRAEGRGLLTIDGPGGLGERFLAESHRFPGFDHDGLSQALVTRRARLVCYSR